MLWRGSRQILFLLYLLFFFTCEGGDRLYFSSIYLFFHLFYCFSHEGDQGDRFYFFFIFFFSHSLFLSFSFLVLSFFFFSLSFLYLFLVSLFNFFLSLFLSRRTPRRWILFFFIYSCFFFSSFYVSVMKETKDIIFLYLFTCLQLFCHEGDEGNGFALVWTKRNNSLVWFGWRESLEGETLREKKNYPQWLNSLYF